MKTFIKILLAVLLVPGVVACGDVGDGDLGTSCSIVESTTLMRP